MQSPICLRKTCNGNVAVLAKYTNLAKMGHDKNRIKDYSGPEVFNIFAVNVQYEVKYFHLKCVSSFKLVLHQLRQT